MITYIKGLENSGPFKKGNNACGVKVLCCSCVLNFDLFAIM